MVEIKDNKIFIGQTPVRRSYLVAGAIFLLLAIWVGSGSIPGIGNFEDKGTGKGAMTAEAATSSTQPGKDKPNTKIDPKPQVRVKALTAETRQQALTIRGQTHALRKVQVRAETAGTVAAIRADKGSMVKAGDTICQLNVDARVAMLSEARATETQRKLEYEASKKLQEKGFRSDTSVAGDLARYQSAKAQVERMEHEFENTKIKAPFAGVIDDRMVEVGDYLSPGQPCATVLDQDPFLVVGQVSEKDILQVRIGDTGWAKLITGERVEGKVRFVSKSADQATRTFRMELEVPNPKGLIRDGVTAEIHINAGNVEAHRISPAILSLDDKGTVGVRIVDAQKKVRFMPVTIVAEGTDGVRVTGLPKTATIITVGQEFVTNGQEVDATPEDKATQS
jgi:multidrug efflux system membrane fusion protein